MEKIVTRHATDLACASWPAPSAAPTSDCAAIASESSTSARKFHSCSTTWWAATAAAPNRAATAPADTKQAWNAIVRSTRSRPMTTWARSTAGWIRSGTRSASSERRNSSGGHPLPHQVRDRRAGELQPRHAEPAVHQQRTQHRRHREAGDDVAQRACGVLHAAHPAVARRRDQDRRHAHDRDPDPRQRGCRRCHRRRPTPTPTAPRRPRPRRRSACPGPAPARWPARLPRRPPPRLPAPKNLRRARGGAVRQEGHLRAERAQNQPADRQPGQRQRAQPADDGDVEQQVDRFGGQHPERGEGQARRCAYRWPGRPADRPPAQPRAVYSACTTSSADPVAE